MEFQELQNKLVDSCFAIKPRSPQEFKVLYEFSRLFEKYMLDTKDEKNAAQHLEKLKSRINMDQIFLDEILQNKLLFAKAHEQLLGMNLTHNPAVKPNDRYAIKVAHILYGGKENEQQRLIAVQRVQNIFNKKPKPSQELPREPSKTPLPRRETSTTQTYEASNENKELYQTIMDMRNMMSEMRQNQNNFTREEVMEMIHDGINRRFSQDNELNIDQGSSPRQRSHPNYSQQIERANTRSHIDVANRLKNNENKYGGRDDENLQEFLDQYFLISDDCQLSQTERLQYLHNIFKGEALNFYKNEVKGKEHTLGGAIAKIQNYFNGIDEQQRVKAELNLLSLESFVRKCRGNV